MPTRTTPLTRLNRLAVVAALALAALLATLAPAQPADAAAKAKDVRASVVSGYQPDPAQWPWIAALLDKTVAGSDYDRHFCGGTLVSPTVVLTAAHCVSKQGVVKPASSLQVALGKRRLSAAGGEHLDVAAVAVHPSYTAASEGFDVALLYLRSPSAMPPASLLAAGVRIPRGTSATVMGWGALYKDGPYPDDLQAVDLAVWSDADCGSAGYTAEQREAHARLYNPQTMLCAGDYTSSKISCYGDSGGPLMVGDGAGGWRLIGVVSFDVGGCAGYHNPDIYAWVHGPTLQPWVMAGIARAGEYAARPTPTPVAAPAPTASRTSAACAAARTAVSRSTSRLRTARRRHRQARRPAAKRRLRQRVASRRAALRHAKSLVRQACSVDSRAAVDFGPGPRHARPGRSRGPG